jgi:hypothetical protein
MLSTPSVESPAATDPGALPDLVPARGYEPLRPEPDGALAEPRSLVAGFRMLGAAAGDVAGVLGGGGPTDPLDGRDPEYIRETLPALRPPSSLYFRADVRGLENIPAAGPVLVVGNHSGGTMIADTFVLARPSMTSWGRSGGSISSRTISCSRSRGRERSCSVTERFRPPLTA